MKMKSTKDVGAIVLAGGKSSRFGSDKAIFLYQGEPLIQRIIRIVEPITLNIRVIANWEQPPAFIRYPVHQDLIPDLGPLGGIFTGLTHSPNFYNLVLPCDMPHLSVECLRYLLEQANEWDITVAAYENRIEPLVAVYSQNCLPLIKNQIDERKMQIRQLFKTIPFRKVFFSTAIACYHPQIFFNMNIPEK